MKIIDLNKYDLSYDIQFLWFMIELIKPYILFEKPLMEKEDDCTYPMINIYRRVPNPEIQLHTSDRGDDNTKLPPPTTSDKSIVGLTNREGLQIISFEEYIHFIQYTFPKMVEDEILKNQEKLHYVKFRNDMLNDQRKTFPRFKLPMFHSIEYDEENYEEIIMKLNQLKENEIKIVKDENLKNMRNLQDNIKYFEGIIKINRENNGSIENVVCFIRKLSYLMLNETKDRLFQIIHSDGRTNNALK